MFKHPEDQAKYIARWKEENRDHIKQWHHNNYLNKALQRYGLTKEEYVEKTTPNSLRKPLNTWSDIRNEPSP